jgi:hypothetical protein
LASGKHMPVEFVATGVTDEESRSLERELIAKHGRVMDGGTLLNGHHGSRGYAVRTPGNPHFQ